MPVYGFNSNKMSRGVCVLNEPDVQACITKGRVNYQKEKNKYTRLPGKPFMKRKEEYALEDDDEVETAGDRVRSFTVHGETIIAVNDLLVPSPTSTSSTSTNSSAPWTLLLRRVQRRIVVREGDATGYDTAHGATAFTREGGHVYQLGILRVVELP